MKAHKKVKRQDIIAQYDNDDDIILYEGDFNSYVDPIETIHPIISQLDNYKHYDILQAKIVNEFDLWILAIEDDVLDGTIANAINMFENDYKNYMKINYSAFEYIDSLAYKTQDEAQTAVDWVNSKILMLELSKQQEQGLV